MRHIITLILLVLLSVPGHIFSQEEMKQELQSTLETYIDLVESKNMAGTLDYIHPKLFEVAPREMIQAAMEQAFSDTTVILDMKDGQVAKIQDIVSVEGGYYSLVDYTFTMSMKYADSAASPEESDENGEIDDPMTFTRKIMEMQHGKDAVSFDEESQTLYIQVSNTLYAINDAQTEGWKFLEKKENMKGLLDEVIPETALESLN